jgi:hypothetical protein
MARTGPQKELLLRTDARGRKTTNDYTPQKAGARNFRAFAFAQKNKFFFAFPLY